MLQIEVAQHQFRKGHHYGCFKVYHKIRKGQHLTSEEQHNIEVHLKDGWSTYKIARHLCQTYNTVKNEVERGTVILYTGKVKRYKAAVDEQVYKEHRQSSAKKYHALETIGFLQYVVQQFKNNGWSLDACYLKKERWSVII